MSRSALNRVTRLTAVLALATILATGAQNGAIAAPATTMGAPGLAHPRLRHLSAARPREASRPAMQRIAADAATRDVS